MQKTFSDNLINFSNMLMLAHDRSEIINLASQMNDLICKAIEMENNGTFVLPKENKKTLSGTIKFSQKEIDMMSKTFKKEFIANGCVAHIIKRPSGKNGFYYEIRYRRNGYNISVSNKDLATTKTLFIEATKQLENLTIKSTVPTTFHEFATYYFENFRIKKVSKETYSGDVGRYKNHIQPHFGSKPLKKITTSDCQILIDKYVKKGMGKTADEIFSLLNCIFKMAIAHNLITQNPLALVIHSEHERTHGKALTKQEERNLLDGLKGTRYLIPFAVALYTGLRPNEYKTAKLQGDFIISVNSKRKNKNTEYKRIAISPMLKPYLENVTELDFPYVESMRTHMNKHVTGHKLYDMRTTFYSRCRECGVADAARDEFMGHSSGALANAYTDLSDEYLLKEIQKLQY